MERKKRWLFVLTFVLSGISVALLSASLGTDFWIVARPIRLVDKDTIGGAKNVTGGDLDTKFQGYLNFGLFHGYKELDHGLGLRKLEIWMAEQASEHGLFNFGLWVSVIVVLILAIVWGLVSMGFSILNASTRPIETITGPAGLYLWNGLALVFSMASFIIYLVLYFLDFKNNVLSPEDTTIYNWTSEDRANLNFSFYFVVVSAGLFACNIILIILSGAQCKSMKYRADVNEKALDGVMMY